MQLFAYLRLMRLHKPVGIWLLLWPTWSALWLAAKGRPPLVLFLSFTAGVVIMRSLGCVINDIADKDIDGQVPRTKDRVLVQKQLSVRSAIWLSIVLLLLALVCVWPLEHVFPLACIALALATIYPFVKRFSHLPQVVLGAAFAMGIPMAARAQLGVVPVWSWILYSATLFWVIAYDTEYAIVDREADQRIGIHSTAILFGKNDSIMIGVLLTLAWIFWAWLGLHLHLNFFYWAALIVIAGMISLQLWWLRHKDPIQCFRAFLQNQWLGLTFFLGIALQGERHFWMLLPN